ncbi:MAG: UDP-3-O-(3-hydroxymyristoyl)glucosamine N-acyltransferase [Calothrix sp. SM1_7_51]|nr:UDP-3-O-(3-hydroxymyristoyl)glucosamine N-acyltransferase [Calothrix sp. SM1_7_51]
MKFSEIVEKFGNAAITSSLEVKQDLNPEITSVAAVDEATNVTISYIDGAKFAPFVATTNAKALILPQNETLQAQALERGIAWISVKEPRLGFAQAIAMFYKPWRPAPEIHPTAVIHPTAKIGKDVAISAHVVIEEGVEIGDGVCIHPNVVVYPYSKIGDRTVLYANCTIQERSQIGADCVINSGTVIGGEGFGYVPTASGWLKMEQSGYVVLENGVEIGCNSAVDRPAVGETRIGTQTKLDNMVHIGHGCQIGFGCAMAAQVGLAGGVKVGNRVILAGQVGVANNTEIGDGAVASSKAGVHTKVPAGEIVSGYPAVSHHIYLESSAIYKRLPEMYKMFRKLQKKFNNSDE